MPKSTVSKLKPTGSSTINREVPSTELLKSEYASRYLESLGAASTPANVKTLLKELPIEKALVVPVWAKGEMAIFPGMAHARKADKDHLLKSMYTANTEETNARPGGQSAKVILPPTKTKSKSDNDDINEGAVTTGNKGGEQVARLDQAINKKATVGQVPKTETPTGRKISWSTVHTLDMNNPMLDRGVTEPLLQPAEILHSSFKKLLVPPSYRQTDLDGSIYLFSTNLAQYAPRVKDDKSGDTFNEVKRVISCDLAHRLYRKLLEYSYWNVLHPWANDLYSRAAYLRDISSPVGRKGRDQTVSFDVPVGSAEAGNDDELSQSSEAGPVSAGSQSRGTTEAGSNMSMTVVDKEQLFLEVEEVLLQLKRKIGNTKKAVSTSLQALVCLCHYAVDDLLTMLYPWLDEWEIITHKDRLRARRRRLGLSKKEAAALPPFSDEELAAFQAEDENRIKKRTAARKVRRLVHQAIADLLDPSRIFTDHMLIANYVGTDHVSLTKVSSRARFYNTSIAVRSVLGDAGSDNVRRFMKYNDSEYISAPGVSAPFADGGGLVDSVSLDSRTGAPRLSFGQQVTLQRTQAKAVAEEKAREAALLAENKKMKDLSLLTPLSMTAREARWKERESRHGAMQHYVPPPKEATISELLGLADTTEVVVEKRRPDESAVDVMIAKNASVGNGQGHYANKVKVASIARELTERLRDSHHHSVVDDRCVAASVDLNTNKFRSKEEQARWATGGASREPSESSQASGRFDLHDIFGNSGEGDTSSGTDKGFATIPTIPKTVNGAWQSMGVGTRDNFRQTRTLNPVHRAMDESTTSFEENSLATRDSLQTTDADARSVVQNKRANFKVRLEVQSKLMDVVVQEKAAAYSDIEKVRKRILLQRD